MCLWLVWKASALGRRKTLFKRQLKPQPKQKDKPPTPPLFEKRCHSMTFYNCTLSSGMVDKNNENTYMIHKEISWSCVMCLRVFLALGTISKLLIGSIKLSLTFQELVSALEENPYGGYCLPLELGPPCPSVTVAGTLQLRWGLWGGLHVGMSHLILVCAPFSPLQVVYWC